MADTSDAASAANSQPQPRTAARQQPNLFERIGGRAAVERIVREFYDRVEQDEELRALFPDDLDEGRVKQALFLEQWLGGEPRYSAAHGHPRLRMRHFPFAIDQRAAGRWLRYMGEAFRAVGIPDAEMQEVFAGLGPLARHMVNAGDAAAPADVPREPPRPASVEIGFMMVEPGNALHDEPRREPRDTPPR